jgi:hypothetical protein
LKASTQDQAAEPIRAVTAPDAIAHQAGQELVTRRDDCREQDLLGTSGRPA